MKNGWSLLIFVNKKNLLNFSIFSIYKHLFISLYNIWIISSKHYLIPIEDRFWNFWKPKICQSKIFRLIFLLRKKRCHIIFLCSKKQILWVMREKDNSSFIRSIPVSSKKLWITFYLYTINAMTSKKTLALLGIKLWLVVAMLLTGRAVYDQLPEPTPRHRNIQGQVDGYWTKMGAVFSIPLIVMAIIVLFRFLPKIDPKKANYEKFGNTWEIIQCTIIWFMAYAHFISLFMILNPEYSINSFMLFGLGAMFVLMGNYMGKIKHNFFVGIKTPRTIADEDVWKKTHRLSGWLWVIAWLIFLAEAFILKYIAVTFIITMIIVVLVPMIYSYWLFRNRGIR